ncbi:MAG: carboxyl transferase [Lachnospiraceae bacterium]|nr:carboxyl transferase [Lachnospiraceae bacterium]
MSSSSLSARERIEYLLDSNSFVEIGAAVTKRSTDFNLGAIDVCNDGVITGYGVISSTPVYVYSQDITALGGTVGEMHAKKIAALYDLAMKVGAPVIGLIDCGGLRLQEATDALDGFGTIYTKQVMASGVIPQFTAVFGKCGGALAVNTSLSDFSFIVDKQGELFVNAPNTIDFSGNNDTGSASFQAQCGNVDFVYDSDEELLSAMSKLISFMPANNEDEAMYFPESDDLNRENVVNESVKDSVFILRDISDNCEFIEVKKEFAKDMVTGFIRLNGMTVGAVANRSCVYDDEGNVTETLGERITADGMTKAVKFIKFCDAFNIPLLSITSTAGFATGLEDEKRIAREAANLTYAFANATVPKINLVTDKAFGSAYVVMNSKHIGADMMFAWNGAKIGTMESSDMAAKIMYPDITDNNILKEKAGEYDSLQQDVTSAAKRGYVDVVIEPRFTRKNLIFAFEMLYTKREQRPDKKHGTV